jgi:NAD-dependent deacetylase
VSGAPSRPELERARALVRGAGTLLVLTGAGVSAESGVPTFRGDGGLWKSWRPEDLATPEAFRRDPRLVWEWYGWRRELVAGCRPNPGHAAIARAALGGKALALVTQNVDGLHEVAARAAANGADPSPALPVELHGSLFRSRCTRCGRRSSDRTPVDATSAGTLPRCGACAELLRPDIVWFGEMLDPAVLERAFEAARAADVCLVVGTSALVHPAASIPYATLEAGGALVEVNPTETPLTPLAASVLRGPAGEILPELLAPL